ncbi:MAG: RNA 2',3'-cyclic phosphodiesterase [Marinilabiliaceae bacterium]
MGNIRTFVALPVAGLYDLERWARELKNRQGNARIKWIPCHMWHLTLKFIGEVDEEELAALRQSLRNALEGFPRGDVAFEGSGFFGHPHAPKVIWAGVRPNDYLETLKKKVEEGASVLDLPFDDRPFRPHLTLGRIKVINDPALLTREVEKNRETFWGEEPVDQIALFKSKLTSKGPVYSVIEQFDLSTK